MSKIYSVQDQLDRLLQGSLDLSAYYTRLTTLWEELKNFEELPSCVCGKCTCGSNDKWMQLYDKRNIVRFLMRLNDSFAQTRKQTIMMDSLPTFTKIYNFVAQDEQQGSLVSTTPEPAVFQATVNQGQHQPQGNVYQGKPRPICSHCGLLVHIAARCYKVHGYRPRYKTPTGYKAKGKFPSHNAVHMVYSQSDNTLNQDTPPNQVLSFNGTQYAPVGSTAPAPLSQPVNHSVNMVNARTNLVDGSSSQDGTSQIAQLITQLNRHLQESAYQVVGPSSASGSSCSISAQGSFTGHDD